MFRADKYAGGEDDKYHNVKTRGVPSVGNKFNRSSALAVNTIGTRISTAATKEFFGGSTL
jgi:hypothetical protein